MNSRVAAGRRDLLLVLGVADLGVENVQLLGLDVGLEVELPQPVLDLLGRALERHVLPDGGVGLLQSQLRSGLEDFAAQDRDVAVAVAEDVEPAVELRGLHLRVLLDLDAERVVRGDAVLVDAGDGRRVLSRCLGPPLVIPRRHPAEERVTEGQAGKACLDRDGLAPSVAQLWPLEQR